ncbi:MAG: HD domain-containing protein, partial [Proteobacteria bacterium]|nr:HD domain-containing protein [Pseudomonadota bacterium]
MSAGTDDVKIDHHALVTSLSEALGLVGGKIIDHGKRVAHIALNLARTMDLSEDELDDLYMAALLHDAGVSRTRTHRLLMQFDWEGAFEHCQDGAALVKPFPPFDRVADIILHHHTKWSELAELDVPLRTALMANLVFLADRIDILLDWNRELLLSRPNVEARLTELAGHYFNPRAVAAFRERARVEVFWLSLYPRHLPWSLSNLAPRRVKFFNLDELESIAGIFARIVDNKSPFTRHHSEGVARLCDYFAQGEGLADQTRQKLRVCGLLHDLGKLAVPDEILEKPAELTPEEFQIIKRHPFDTHHVLSGLDGIEDIREWAAYHHEKIDGSGYPFHIDGRSPEPEHFIV